MSEQQPIALQSGRRRWRLMLLVLAIVVIAAAFWLRPPRHDERLFGEWSFLATDGTNLRHFLTFKPDGTAVFQEEQAEQSGRLQPLAALDWWMEGDVIAFQQRFPTRAKLMHMAHDAVELLQSRKWPDRVDFRLQVLERSPQRLLFREVGTGTAQPLEYEMFRSKQQPIAEATGN